MSGHSKWNNIKKRKEAVDQKRGKIFTKLGSVSFQFEKRGELILEKEKYPDEDQVMLDAMEAGCQDIVTSEDYYEIITKAEDYNKVLQQLSTAGYEFADLSVGPQPLVTVEVDSEEDRENLEKLIDRLEEVDDVQEVFHNWASDD